MLLKQWRIALILIVAAAMGVFISACGADTTTAAGSTPTASTGAASTAGTPGSYNCVPGTIVANGSTALQPLVQAVATTYAAKCSGANITVGLGGSGVGLTNVEGGSAQIGDSDVFSKTGQEDLVDHQVAVVIFSLIINVKVTGVKGLTTAQIKDIYSGKVTNWSQVGGPNLNIVVVSRPTTSGTRATFQSYVLGGPETVTSPSSLTTDTTGTVVKNVTQTDGAIGYVALSAAKKSNLTLLQIDGNDPTATLVENNTYKFWNIEHMYTKGAATGLSQALIDYMLSADGKTAAQTLAFVSISDMSADALTLHQPKKS